VISTVEIEDLSGILAFLDFEKAFDKLNWMFLQKSLSNFGFGAGFKKWVKVLYTDVESCIFNNGTTSSYFSIGSGVRQGCPLSALLFILCVEILAINIRNNQSIQGIKVNGKEFKITQLADDMTLFLNDLNSLKTVLKL
jgi:hypothetical protein